MAVAPAADGQGPLVGWAGYWSMGETAVRRGGPGIRVGGLVGQVRPARPGDDTVATQVVGLVLTASMSSMHSLMGVAHSHRRG